MEAKYEFTGATKVNALGITLRQIRAVRNFGNVIAGQLGGWIEEEYNLDHTGHCWIDEHSEVSGRSGVRGNAQVVRSALTNEAWAQHDAVITDSLLQHSSVMDASKVTRCISRFSSVYNDSEVTNCTLSGRTLVEDCIVTDSNVTACTLENAEVSNSVLKHLTILSGEVKSTHDVATFDIPFIAAAGNTNTYRLTVLKTGEAFSYHGGKEAFAVEELIPTLPKEIAAQIQEFLNSK